MKKVGAVALVILLLPPLQGGDLARTFPEAVPRVEGWEKITGDVEIYRPALTVKYEFYVNPKRFGFYEVVRYRITPSDPRTTEDYGTNEKLQWDMDGRNLRRFECSEEGQWRELPRGSREYHREAGVIIWLYGLHRRLLHEREKGSGPPP